MTAKPNIDKVFDIVDRALGRQSEFVVIQMTDRVFLCDCGDLPEHGVPNDGTLRFRGCEITADDLVPDGGEWRWGGDCGPELLADAAGFKVVRERRSGRRK